MWYVYVLLCSDSSLYTGSTNNIEKRFFHHIHGKGGAYTRSHKPVKILHSESVATKSEALKREAYIKHLTREMKIRELHLSV